MSGKQVCFLYLFLCVACGEWWLAGLLGGLLSFGGAYTAVPFVQQATVQAGWITTKQFLDGLGRQRQRMIHT